MGSDKALASFAGIPLIQNAIQILSLAGLSSRIAGSQLGPSQSALSEYTEIIPDTYFGSGPLGGIQAALSVTGFEWNLFLPVDMPLIPPSLITGMLERACLTGCPVVAARLLGRLEPFPVLLHRCVLPPLTGRLENGQTAGHQAWQTIPAQLGSTLDAPELEYLVQTGNISHPLHLPTTDWYRSANTPADLALINQLHNLRQP